MPPGKDSSSFPSTHWTFVRAVQGGSADESAQAMEQLCKRYWYPIYAFLRRSGHNPQDAEDQTQAFFERLISDEVMQSARQGEGKLRSFLLGVLKRHLSRTHTHDSAQKRGGGVVHVSFDEMEAEERYACEPQETRDPEWHFNHAWAKELMDGVLKKLREVLAASGRDKMFDTLLPYLMWDTEPPSHKDIAQQLGITEAGASVLIFRLRRSFRDLLHKEVATTVLNRHEIPGELEWLQSVLVK